MFGALKPFLFFLSGSASVLVLATLIGTGHPAFVALLCLVLLLAGLPHGAFDYHILSARYEGSAFACALVIYLGLTGMTVVLWWLLPLWFLSSFLAYSAFHFGDSDWPDQGALRKWAWGLSIVGLPCLLAPRTVEPLFAVIAGITEVALLTKVTGLMSIPATALCCLPDRVSDGNRWNPKPVLLLSYGGMCWVAGPLAAFGCYFACLHSPFHLTRWRRRIEGTSMGGIHALSALVLVSVVGLVWWFPVAWDADLGSSLDGSALRYTFLALAALTVPHMTLLFFAKREPDLGSNRNTPKAPSLSSGEGNPETMSG